MAIFAAVIISNIEWKWSENSYAVGLIALFAAAITSQLTAYLIDCVTSLLRRRASNRGAKP